jgi:hypothetical protein
MKVSSAQEPASHDAGMHSKAAAKAATLTEDTRKDMLMIESDDIEVCSNLRAAILEAACAASTCLQESNQGKAGKAQTGGVYVRLRHMVVTRGPTECQASGDSLLLDYGQVPHAIGRMVVQLPSLYTAGMHGTVSACLNGDHRSFNLERKSEEAFQYVLGYSQSAMHIHAPSRGCAAFLVFDVVSLTPVCGLALAGCHAAAAAAEAGQEGSEAGQEGSHDAEATLEECVRYWEEDASCKKLAMVLEGEEHLLGGMTCARLFGQARCLKRFKNLRNEAIVQTLMNCRDLEVGFAGV